jgi:hypothetical protein
MPALDHTPSTELINPMNNFTFYINVITLNENNFLGSKARPARKADNLNAISEPIVKVMRDP